jgi:hypothetical protein
MTKKLILFITILLFPFFLMIITNETTKNHINPHNHYYKNVKTINPGIRIKNKCTWICHDNTNYCKKYHIKYLKNQLKTTDKFYFGLISSLKKTGNYGLANIIFLVVLIPFSIGYFTIKSITILIKIKNLQ